MRSFLKLSAPVCLICGMTVVVIGLRLSQEPDLSWLARLFSQTGTLNEKILAKAQILPSALVLLGIESLLLGFVCFFYRQKISDFSTVVAASLQPIQRLAILALSLYGLITILALNFGAVNLFTRMATSFSLSNDEMIATDFREEYSVLKALREETSENACILIRTRSSIKYLINYHLFPRRFFFYPDPDKSIGEIPVEWLQKHEITWAVEIADDDPRQFVLQALNKARETHR